MADNQDILSNEDLLALHQTYMHLHDAGDPRAEKLRQYLIYSGKQALANPQANQTQFEKDRNPDNQQGGLSSYASEAGSILKNAPQIAKQILDPSSAARAGLESGANIIPDWQRRTAEGRSTGYKAAAVVAPLVGANVNKMEQQADVGNGWGVAGTALADVTPVVAAELARTPQGQRVTAKLSNLPSAAAQSLTSVGDRMFLEGTPNQLMVKALRPSVVTPELDTAIQRRMGEVYQQGEANGAPVNNLENYRQAVDAAKEGRDIAYQNLMARYRQPAGGVVNGEFVPAAGPHEPVTVNGNPVADAQMRSIPATESFERPNQTNFVQRGSRIVEQGDAGIVNKIADKANQYRTDIPLDTADNIRVDTNAKLRDFWQKAGGDRQAARSNPETARIEAVNNGVRDLVYNELQKRTGIDPRPIQDSFGDLSEISDAANKRGVIYGRQNPVSLAEQVGAAEKGIKAFITAKLLKTYNNPNTIIRVAYERWAQENGITPSWKANGKLSPSSASPIVTAPLPHNGGQ